MCLIAFAYRAHPEYKLILIANRDEFYERPTREAQFWSEEKQPDILGGKDLEAGGMWIGINQKMKFGALTNYRDPSWKRVHPPSRGAIVHDYLSGDTNPQTYLKNLKKGAQVYNGFNVLAGDTESMYHYSNVSDTITTIEPGVHGVSNALLNTSWPKLDQTKERLETTIASGFYQDDLFALLTDNTHADNDKLPSTGIPLEWEKALSSVFIKTDNYGTRCSTLLLIKNDNSITFTERRYPTHNPEEFTEKTFNL